MFFAFLVILEMKLWKAVLFLLVMPQLAGCGGGHDARVTAELDRADSLLLTSDTAAHRAVLNQMLALDTAGALRADEALRARHALLLVQARYKCYETLPADSVLIATARGYYADHHSSNQDHERYTRTLIYSGAVAEELGHPQQAMQHYLEAESTAAPNDHFNLGYTNLRIAELYEGENVSDSTDIERLKKALPYFVKAGSDYYQAVCLTGIGGLYRTHNNDTALHYLQQAISFSKEHGLTYNYYEALDKLCGLYYYKKDYTKAKNVADKIHRESQGVYDDFQYLSFGIRSFAKLGMTDSAEYYLKLLPDPKTAVDSMMYHRNLSIIAEAKGDKMAFIANYIKTDDDADTIIRHSNADSLKRIEQQHNKNRLQNETMKAYRKVWILWILVTLAILILLYIAFRFFKTRKLMAQLDKENKLITQELNGLLKKTCHLEQKVKEGQERDLFASRAIDYEVAILSELSGNLSIPRKVSFKDVLFSSGITTKLTKPLSIEFWEKLSKLADMKTKGIISYLNENYDCKPKDLRFIALVSLGFSNQLIQLCMNYYNANTVNNYKSGIIKKITGENKSIGSFIEEYTKNH